MIHRPVGLAVTRSFLEREVLGSNLGPVKSNTVLSTARHRCDSSSEGAVLPWRNDAEMGPANSLHASTYYSEYNERFDLLFLLSSPEQIRLTLRTNLRKVSLKPNFIESYAKKVATVLNKQACLSIQYVHLHK